MLCRTYMTIGSKFICSNMRVVHFRPSGCILPRRGCSWGRCAGTDDNGKEETDNQVPDGGWKKHGMDVGPRIVRCEEQGQWTWAMPCARVRHRLCVAGFPRILPNIGLFTA